MKIDALGVGIVLAVVGILSMPFWKPPLDKIVLNALDNPYKCNMIVVKTDGEVVSSHEIIKRSTLVEYKSKKSVLDGVNLYPYLEFNDTFSTNAVPNASIQSALVLCSKV